MPEQDSSPGLKFHLDAAVSSVLPGALAGILVVIMSISLAAMIFSGRLSAYVGSGIALAINTAIISGLGFTLFSRCKPVISMVDEDTTPVFALMASMVAASLPLAASDHDAYSAALAAIVATTVISGLGLVLLGTFRFGKFIEYLPHSVMGGYFAAVGWLLVLGGLKVVTDADPYTLAGLYALTTVDELPHWLPALAVAMWLLFMRDRIPQTTLVPLTVLMSVGIWYGVYGVAGLTPGAALEKGLLLGPFGDQDTQLLNPLAGVSITQVDWSLVFGNSGSIASIFLISILSLMLSISGLGYLNRIDPDMNHELRTAGLANMASGFGGGMTGLPSYSLSSLAINMGAANNRWSGVFAVTVCVVVFLFGLDAVAYIPRFILSGILIYLGLGLLREWMIGGLQKFSPLEYLVIPIILGVSVTVGFLQSVLVGLIAAIFLFVVKYSQTRVIAYVTNGAQLMSNVDRTAGAQEIIQAHGDHLLAMSLQGYLFFGTAAQVYAKLQERLDAAEKPGIRHLLVDFSRVTGLDASAALNFQKMLLKAQTEDFNLIVTGLEPELRARLEKGGFDPDDSGHLFYHADMDHALEWCENQLLGQHPGEMQHQGCFEQLTDFLTPSQIAQLMTYLVKREVEANHVLANQGDESDQLFFMETCAASAYIRDSRGEFHRVRHTTRGTVFGELGFYLGIPRTATVITDEAGLIYILDQQSLLEMQAGDPEVAAGLHRYMAMLLSERLMFTTRTLRALLM